MRCVMKKPLVTEIDNVETKRVLAARNRAHMWKNLFFMILFAGLVVLLLPAYNAGDTNAVYVGGVMYVIVYFVASHYVNKKYNEVLNVARLNDQIRHEEKVRGVERDKHNLEKEIERLKLELEHAKNQSKKID